MINAGGVLRIYDGDSNLWRSDGTPGGTSLIKKLTGWEGWYYAVSGNITYHNGEVIRKVWRSDGTPDGTYVILSGTKVRYLSAVNGRVLLDGGDYSQLWIGDGTTSGTVPSTKPIYPYGPSCELNGQLYFFARQNVYPYGDAGFWKSDGTDAGTVKLADLSNEAMWSDQKSMRAWNGVLYFQAADQTHGMELWRTDGTTAGTWMVKDIVPGSASSDPRYLVCYQNSLFFCANHSQIWRTDGTADGTVFVAEPFALASENLRHRPLPGLTPSGECLYFCSPTVPGMVSDLWALAPFNATRHWKDYR